MTHGTLSQKMSEQQWRITCTGSSTTLFAGGFGSKVQVVSDNAEVTGAARRAGSGAPNCCAAGAAARCEFLKTDGAALRVQCFVIVTYDEP